jgi:ribosomal protein S18 acetylase RimI-like enzyme
LKSIQISKISYKWNERKFCIRGKIKIWFNEKFFYWCFSKVVLETECHNTLAISLYERLGFIREKRLTGYYLNGKDAFRLKLYLSWNVLKHDELLCK